MADNELARALAAFHADLPEVAKGSTNPAFKSKYADLADIVKVVLPKLAKQGLAWTTTPTMDGDHFVLTYQLMHVSGESVTGSWPLPDPTKATPQQLGSAVTYGKRYTLSAVTGIAPDEDDDGNAASAKGVPRAASRPSAQERIQNAAAALRSATDGPALEKVWAQVHISGLDGIPELIKLHDEALKTHGPVGDGWSVAEVKP